MLAVLTFILIVLATFTYQNAPVRYDYKSESPSCDIGTPCPAVFFLETTEIKDRSVAKRYIAMATITGITFVVSEIYFRKLKKK